uniref:Uncharacterized protein n=1 Tax=Megaselia scalaris TaxID=36166 RepID=T1GTD6_MEGSC
PLARKRQNFICLDCIIVVNSSEEIYRQSTLKNERFLKGGLVQQKKTESKAIPTATSNRKKSPQSKKRPQKILKTDDKIVDDFVWIDRFPCPFLNCDFASDRIQVASQHCAFTHKLFPFYYCKKCNQRFICDPEAGMETLIINPTAEDEPIIEKAQELVPQAIPSISETVPESISELIPESIPELITESVPELIPAEPQLKNIPFKPCEIKLARCCVCETVNNLRPLKPTIIPVLKRQKKERLFGYAP